MSDTLVLRKIYATDSNTGLYISTAGQVLTTDDKGGTNWIPIISTLSLFGGPSVGVLPSTLNLMSTQIWGAQSNISVIQYNLSNQNPGQITLNNLTSTVAGLGTASYVSSASLVSTTSNIFDTVNFNLDTAITSTIEGLGTFGYTSTSYAPEFTSTIEGLGSSGYVSSLDLISSFNGLGTLNYISSLSLNSTVQGLGRVGYVSTASLVSTVRGLGGAGYISTPNLVSTVRGLGGAGGLNSYVSTASLVSTTISLSTIQSRISFTNVNTCFIRSSQVNISSVNNLLFLSSFYYSSIAPTSFTGYGTALTVDTSNIYFSTASFDLTPFSNYIVSTTRLSLELYPTYLFSKLSDNATSPGIIPISTMIQVGNDFLSTTTTSYIVAQTQNLTAPSIPGSNVFNQPIRVEIPPSSIVGDFTSTVTLFHFLPGALFSGPPENAFINGNYSFYFGRPGAFLTVQNSIEY
jgi:hypothetical protein